jgi:hypothetical protein
VSNMALISQSLTPLMRDQLSAVFNGGKIDARAVHREASGTGSQIHGACISLTTAVIEQLDRIGRSPSIASNGGNILNLDFPGVVNDVMNPSPDQGGPGGSAVDGTANFSELQQWAREHLGVELQRESSLAGVRVTLPSEVVLGAQAEYQKIAGPALPPSGLGYQTRHFQNPQEVRRHPALQVADASEHPLRQRFQRAGFGQKPSSSRVERNIGAYDGAQAGEKVGGAVIGSNESISLVLTLGDGDRIQLRKVTDMNKARAGQANSASVEAVAMDNTPLLLTQGEIDALSKNKAIQEFLSSPFQASFPPSFP